MIKLKVRESSIFYGKEKAKSRRTDETKQYDTITYLEKKIDGTMSPILKGELEKKLIEAKENLEKMYEYKTQGHYLTVPKPAGITKVKKNSKYFFNLEKRQFKRKIISQLCRADNTTLTSDNDILQECVDFYSKLYSSRSIHNESDNLRFFPDDNFVRLDEDSKASCEGLLNVNECLNALKTMEANKSPGSDGFPAEFYKVLWSDLAPLFSECY